MSGPQSKEQCEAAIRASANMAVALYGFSEANRMLGKVKNEIERQQWGER